MRGPRPDRGPLVIVVEGCRQVTLPPLPAPWSSGIPLSTGTPHPSLPSLRSLTTDPSATCTDRTNRSHRPRGPEVSGGRCTPPRPTLSILTHLGSVVSCTPGHPRRTPASKVLSRGPGVFHSGFRRKVNSLREGRGSFGSLARVRVRERGSHPHRCGDDPH